METKKYKALEDLEVAVEPKKVAAGEEVELTEEQATALEGKVELVEAA